MADDFDFAAEATPERIKAALAQRLAVEGGELPHKEHEGEHPDAVSVRTVTHRGHRIVVRTRYDIEVDGHPFNPAVTVDLGGRVHYHGLPTRDFSSMVDLVCKAIDTFPDDFEQASPRDGEGHPGHSDQPDQPHVGHRLEPPSPDLPGQPEGQR